MIPPSAQAFPPPHKTKAPLISLFFYIRGLCVYYPVLLVQFRRRIAAHDTALLRISNGVRPFFRPIRASLQHCTDTMGKHAFVSGFATLRARQRKRDSSKACYRMVQQFRPKKRCPHGTASTAKRFSSAGARAVMRALGVGTVQDSVYGTGDSS